MPKIVAGFLVKDEAAPDRYLKRCVQNALNLCDTVVCLDDHSQDATVGVLKSLLECPDRLIVRERSTSNEIDPSAGFWGKDESTPRAELWALASEVAGPDGWTFVFDADHEVLGIDSTDLATLCETRIYNAYALPLWDCWDSDTQHRVDTYWVGWAYPRVWLARAKPTPDFVPEWGNDPIHAGHLPRNYPLIVGELPGLAGIRHLGYVREEHRLTKHTRYVKLRASETKV